MAIDKIQTAGLGENIEIGGTEAAKMPVGTTAQRASAQSGDIRFNSSTSLMEYYDGNQWKSIDSPPVVSSISPTTESDPNANITITGSNFSTGATVKFVGNDGTEYSSPSVTRNSITEIVATTPVTALSVANEPYDIVVTNTSSLSGTLADALDAGGVPAFNNAAGSLGIIYDSSRTVSGSTLDASATDPDGDTITYSVSVGALPSGLSLNTSTGAITGTATAVGSDTTTTFTISAATASDTSTRQFSITIAAPVVQSFTSTGSGTFSVPTGVTSVDALVVAGGGGGGVWVGGGGGAGGLIYRPAFPVTPGGSVSYTVGTGGAGGTATGPIGGTVNSGAKGQDSVFGTLTAKGGGVGLGYANLGTPIKDGGSGGGASGEQGSADGYTHTVGNGIQSQQPGDSGTYGFGNPGGYGQSDTPWLGGGGGGAGAAGINGTSGAAGQGGVGKQYDISGSQVYYAGGGGGGVNGPPSSTVGAGGNGGGAAGAGTQVDSGPQTTAPSGTANRGGGGGGHGSPGPSSAHTAGAGGSGIVIVKY